MRKTIALSASPRANSTHFDDPSNTVWFTADGTLRAVRLLDGRERTFSGYSAPVCAIPLADGSSLAVVESSGAVLVAPADDADRVNAAVVTTLDAPPHVVARTLDGYGIIADQGDVLVAFDTRTGETTELCSGMTGATSLAIDGAANLAYAVVESAGGADATLVAADLTTGGTADELALLPSQGHRVVSHPASSGILVIDPTGVVHEHDSAGNPTGTTTDLGVAPAALTRWASLLLAVDGATLHAVEWALPESKIQLDLPLAPLFVHGYADVTFDAAAAGLDPAEVELVVLDGADAGKVSAAIEPLGPDGRSRRILFANWQTGEFLLAAQHLVSGDELGFVRFRVTALWPDDEVGPPIVSAPEHAAMTLMSWGGAGGLTGYLEPDPPPSRYRVAVVLVETNERAYGGDLASTVSTWTDYTIGAGVSARTYFEDVSYFNRPGPSGAGTGMTVELAGGRLLGPVAMDRGWGDLFKVRKESESFSGWSSKPTAPQELANAVSVWLMDQPDGHAIAASADAYVFVVRAASLTPTVIGTKLSPARFVWGHARFPEDGPNFTRKHPATSTLTQGPKPIVVMTDVYPVDEDGTPVKEHPEHTLAHELAHTIRLDDLYDRGGLDATVVERLATHADLMATSATLPHLSMANRVRLGWVKRSALRRFDFRMSQTGGSVVLRAAGALTRDGAPAGEAAGIEVPIDDQKSYVFEYRRQAATTVGDKELDELTPEPGLALVLGTDVTPSTELPKRPPILLLPLDGDGEGPVLDVAGEDFEDNDVSDPMRMWDFRVSLDSIDAADPNRARVTVHFVSAHRPQLQLRPAPGGTNFKSPDITLRNPFGEEFVVKGSPHTIRLTIHNKGTLAATDVATHVQWLPFTTAPGSWNPLPDPPRIPVIAAKSTVTIDVPWTPPASLKLNDVEVEHFCVNARIDRFRNPLNPGEDELVVVDNWAQSNFTTESVANGSPSDRIRTVMGFENTLERETTHFFDIRQTRNLFRIYVGHAWLALPPGGSAAIPLAYESVAGDPELGPLIERPEVPLIEVPAEVALTSWLEPPAESECPTPHERFGAGLSFTAGGRVWFEDVAWNGGEIVTARVYTSVDEVVGPLTGGHASLAVWAPDWPDRPALRFPALIDQAGELRAMLEGEFFDLVNEANVVGRLLVHPGIQNARAVSEEFGFN